jgi:sugar (pentulose or hexulose) kinase
VVWLKRFILYPSTSCTLLCGLTARSAGRPVHAGPVEATALGNVLVQARALDAVPDSPEAARNLVARTQPPAVHPLTAERGPDEVHAVPSLHFDLCLER